MNHRDQSPARRTIEPLRAALRIRSGNLVRVLASTALLALSCATPNPAADAPNAAPAEPLPAQAPSSDPAQTDTAPPEPAQAHAVSSEWAHAAPDDPSRHEVPLPAAAGWQASLVFDNEGVGIWTTGTLDAFPQYGCPDIFGLDDRGRCVLLSSYSGKWTPHQTVEDGAWLGALSRLDLDPTVDGREIYCGGQRGNLFQIVPRRQGGFDVATIARFFDQEIHTLVGDDLLPSRPGDELLVFTQRGETYLVLPDGEGGFEATQIANLEARVRQALLLPHTAGERPWIAAVSRSGEVLLLRLTDEGLEQRVILSEPMGLGRMALRTPTVSDEALVLYVTRDDGLLLRLQGTAADDRWQRELVYAGPQGLRGVAAGRFDADPEVETVAVFGYSSKVQLLSRRAGSPWSARTLFVDRDKGHWLATAELDGRNGTDELIASGYGGRIVLLAREPGSGLDGICTDPDPPLRPALTTNDG